MIIGIGCDLVEHEVPQKLGWTDISIMPRLFTKKEIDLYHSNKKIQFLAGRFAVKEAVLKCLGTGMYDGISLTDIQVLRSESGKPVLEIYGSIKELSDEIGVSAWHVSITHSKSFSSAVVIAEKLN